MKKIIAITIVFGAILMSCNNNKSKINTEVPITTEHPVTENLGVKCYESLLNSDTVSMQLNINANNEVNGKLTNIPYQKDRNEGTIVGFVYGDTIIVEYTFTSEGKSSVRELAFLKK